MPFGYVNKRDVEKQFTEVLRREIQKAELRVDDALSEIVRITEQATTGPDVIFQIRLPRAYNDRLALGGEVPYMIVERIANQIIEVLRGGGRSPGGQSQTDPVHAGDGSYL